MSKLKVFFLMLLLVCIVISACAKSEETTECRVDAPLSSGAKKSNIVREHSRLIEQHILVAGAASQGLALTEDAYYSAKNRSICRFDTNWNLIEEKPIRIEGVNHMGAIDYHDGHIWAGFLNHGLTDGKSDPTLNRSIIAKIRAKDLKVIKTWDITDDVKWIDPVCFDGQYLWVGDLSDIGIHRYKLVDDKFIRDGIFRYPKAMHFSQGIRIVKGKLYTIHTFGTMDGLFEFEIPEKLTEAVNQPTRVWEIQETKMHLEGFDFVPGHPNHIWHAQGTQVNHCELKGLPAENRSEEKITKETTDVLITTHIRDDGTTEINIASQDGKVSENYELNLSRHHSPATEQTPALKKWESHRFGAFVCFNSNQFSGKELCQIRDPKLYNPTNLNVGNWIDVIKSAGMKYAVLTSRHSSGFLLWDSPTTDFDVASSGNKTDVVKEFTDECRKQGIAPGLYYCMWGGEWHKHPNARTIILAQLYELAANYGEIPYFWIDMMNWTPKDLPAQEVYDLLKNLQPDTIVILNQHRQDGSKIRYFPTDILNGEVKLPPATGHQPFREVGGKKYYLPFEFEPVSQGTKGISVAETPSGPGCWFTYGAGRSFPASFPLPVEGLYEWIKMAYERGASNVLLSLAPDHSGSMREEDAQQLKQLGKLLEGELKKIRSNR